MAPVNPYKKRPPPSPAKAPVNPYNKRPPLSPIKDKININNPRALAKRRKANTASIDLNTDSDNSDDGSDGGRGFQTARKASANANKAPFDDDSDCECLPPRKKATNVKVLPSSLILFGDSSSDDDCPPKEKKTAAKAPPIPSNNNSTNDDNREGAAMTDSPRVSIFKVFPTKFKCVECDTVLGTGIDALRRHLKKSHPNLKVESVSALHSELVAARNNLAGKPPRILDQSKTVTHLKCSGCGRSYLRISEFNRHLGLSKGKCNNAFATRVQYVSAECGTLVELCSTATATSTTSTPSRTIQVESIERALVKHIRDDEDVGTFVSLFSPLMHPGRDFDSFVANTIDSFETPPAAYELGLQQALLSGESWLLLRARHEVSLVPGNYRASLLQFASQDLGEVSQNLTYNFRHREATLLPELKRLISLLWRSGHPLMTAFQNRNSVNDPYFVARLLTAFFHEHTPSVFHHPLLVQYTLCRFFRKSRDGSLTMRGAGQNASCAAGVLSCLRAGVCSLICSARFEMDSLASYAVRQSQLCRVANVLSPMIRRMREMERRKKKTRMVTVDETGMIAVDGFEIERQQWSLLIPSILSKCKSLLTALLVGDDWQSILDLRNQVAVASGFTFTRILSCGRRLGVDLKLRQGYDASLFDRIIKHCTSVTNTGKDNSVYGCMFGSCRD